MSNFWSLSKDFRVGDTVQRIVACAALSPFVGQVLAVGPNKIAVKFPYGVDKLGHNLVVKVHPKLNQHFAPTLTSLQAKTASAKQWRTTELPSGFHQNLALLWSRTASEVLAYDELWHRYATENNDLLIRDEVKKFYLVARNLFDCRLQEHMQKSAAYWANSNRRYRATAEDIELGRPTCPKCGTAMKKTTYKMVEGEKTRLFACPKDLFLIRQDDLLGPNGEAHTW